MIIRKAEKGGQLAALEPALRNSCFWGAVFAILGAHGNCCDSNPRPYSSLWRTDSGGRCHVQRGTGAVLRLSGPNGAGKSTTIKMLTGLLEPSTGTIEILGKPFSASAVDLKRQIGVVPGGGPVGRLTATEYLRFVGRVRAGPRDNQPADGRTAGIDAACQRDQEACNRLLSHGMQKKLALAAAVIHGQRCCFSTSLSRVSMRSRPEC